MWNSCQQMLPIWQRLFAASLRIFLTSPNYNPLVENKANLMPQV
jgi:hypothetical protein